MNLNVPQEPEESYREERTTPGKQNESRSQNMKKSDFSSNNGTPHNILQI